jgi:Ni2+-binding GTPase involved in maturation of urease and hydrogenase
MEIYSATILLENNINISKTYAQHIAKHCILYILEAREGKNRYEKQNEYIQKISIAHCKTLHIISR